MQHVLARVGAITVKQIFIYPIKSCGAIELHVADVERAGLVWDRAFALVDDDGDVLSQKQHPQLAQVRPHLHVEGKLVVGMTLRSTGGDRQHAAIYLSLEAADATPRTTRWVGHRGSLAAEAYPQADEWLAEVLGVACSLCRLKGPRRLSDSRLAGVSHRDDECRYHDGAPLTIVSAASIDLLNNKMAPGPSLDANRFRPNIVVDGCGAHEEDGWLQTAIGGVRLRSLMEDYRCSMVSVEQRPGARCGQRTHGRRVQDVLEQYRRLPSTRALAGDNPSFAVFAALDEGWRGGRIAVGDQLLVLREVDDASSLYLHNTKTYGGKLSLNKQRFWDHA